MIIRGGAVYAPPLTSDARMALAAWRTLTQRWHILPLALATVVAHLDAAKAQPASIPALSWEATPSSANPPNWDACLIDEPLVQPIQFKARKSAIRALTNTQFKPLSDIEAAALLGVSSKSQRPLAVALFEDHLAKLRQRRHRALIDHRDSWSVQDHADLARLNTRQKIREAARARPYLVGAVSKGGNAPATTTATSACVYRGTLYVQTGALSHIDPPTIRWPVIIFLAKPPLRVIASASVAE